LRKTEITRRKISLLAFCASKNLTWTGLGSKRVLKGTSSKTNLLSRKVTDHLVLRDVAGHVYFQSAKYNPDFTQNGSSKGMYWRRLETGAVCFLAYFVLYNKWGTTITCVTEWHLVGDWKVHLNRLFKF
jgi:hypothetical protein